MPRTGGIYSPPAGTKGAPRTTIQSSKYNALVDDLTLDANAARPLTAGGTGATNALQARKNLGSEIGVDVQAYDAGLLSIAGLTTAANQMLYSTGLDAYATTALTPYARASLLTLADTAALQTLIGLGSMAYVNGVNDANWSGADLSIANGGTGASTADAARTNLGVYSKAQMDASLADIAASIVPVETQIHSATAKAAIADADEMGLADSANSWSLKRFTLANLIASIFKTARTIANAQFAAGSFKLFNAAGTPRALTFDLSALTADRKITMPNFDVSFDEYVRKGASGELTLSNVQFDVTSIPTDAKQVTIKLEEVSTSAGGVPLAILLGTSSAFETTGYKISSAGRSTTGTSTSTITTDIRIPPYSSSTGPYSGVIVMTRVASTNQWLISGSMKNADVAGAIGDVVGFKSLAGLLTRVRLTTSTGAPTLSGSIEIEWER